eukprot:6607836-Karenia_brevis.AAC.1
MDQLLQEAWKQVFDGNVKDVGGLLTNFFSKYHKHLYKAPQYNLDNITGEELRSVCLAASHSSAGMDGWAPADYKLFSVKIFEQMAELLNIIEGGAPWPKPLLHTRAVLLPKDPDD